MKFTEAEFSKINDRWPAPYTNYDDAVKVVYDWVKQDMITPGQMAELLLDAYKNFVW